jgi:glucokinase
MDMTAIGIDLGATKIAAALVTRTGEVLATRSLATVPAEGASAVIDRIALLANELGSEALKYPVKLLGIGIGSPGQVEPVPGIVHNAVNLGWQYVCLADEVQYRLDQPVPVRIQKDGNASAIGEYVFGAAQNCPDFLYLSIGSGLGGGLFAGGQLINGAHWNATELGHISLDPQGRECLCGLRGCAETVLSGSGLVALFKALGKAGVAETALDPKNIGTQDIIWAARDQDALALAVLEETGRCLGIVLSFCAAVTNPALVVIGGGLGLAVFDLIVPRARIELEKRVLQASLSGLRIVPSQQKSSAVGAASLIWYSAERR